MTTTTCSVWCICLLHASISWFRYSCILLADVWVSWFKWKIYYYFIWEEFCREPKYWLKFSHELTKKHCRRARRPHAWLGRRLPTSDQSRASHSGGQLWLLQGSVREGRRGVHAESSRTFSSVPEILLLHNTSRVRRPPLQLRLHSDHSPVHQLEAQKFVFNFLICIEWYTVHRQHCTQAHMCTKRWRWIIQNTTEIRCLFIRITIEVWFRIKPEHSHIDVPKLYLSKYHYAVSIIVCGQTIDHWPT